MRKTVYIVENKLVDLKNAMTSNNTGHSIFMSEDVPPYEADEFEVCGEGGNNDFFHINKKKKLAEIEQNVINLALKLKPNIFARWAVANEYYAKYFEKKKYAIEYYNWVTRTNKSFRLIDTEKYLAENKILSETSFESWFGDSILIDSEGKPIKMYHGTSKKFDAFSKDFIGSSGSGCYEGYGFNFTPAWSRAVCYSSGGNVIEAYLKASHPLKSNEHNITVNQLVGILRKIDEGLPITDTLVPNYESPRYGENWDERYYNRAVKVVAKNLIEFNEEYGDAGIYAGICESCSADPKKVIKIFEEMGYDSVIFFEDDGRIKTVIVFEPNQIKLVGNKTFNSNSEIMGENIEAEVESSEVKLDSFKKNNTLAPRLWDENMDLNPAARLKLLDIADDFWDFVNITWVKRKGIFLTGSICNFNWSKFSDIDLHIVVDFSEIDEKENFVQEYFNSKKNEWNDEHSNLKIFGYPVELYVENINAKTETGGLYDLEKNEWIKKPDSDNIKQIGLDKYEIKNKSAKLMTLIDNLYDEFNATNDDAILRDIRRRVHKLLNKIKRMRKFGLQCGGESDSFNIIYKVLRRAGYMDMLWNLSSELYDKINSIGIDESVIRESIDLFGMAKDYFGITNDFRECGFILPDGSMLDLSGRHTGAKEEDVSGRRRIDHRSVEHISNDKAYVTLTRFLEAGAIRCDIRSGMINLIKRPTQEQVSLLTRFILRCKGNVALEIGDDEIFIDYVEYDGVNYKRVINDIFNFFDNKIKPSSLMECIENIADEINKKKLVAEEKGIHICDFSFVL